MASLAHIGKVLKMVGIGLIALPEPFTTPVGILLLATAYSLPRKPRADSEVCLQQFARTYLDVYHHWTQPISYNNPRTVIRHSLVNEVVHRPPRPEREEAIIRHSLVNSSLNNDWRQTQPVPGKIIHHSLVANTIKYELNARQGMPENVVRHSLSNTVEYDWRAEHEAAPANTIHHSLVNANDYGWRRPAFVRESTIHHSLNRNLPQYARVPAGVR